MNRWGFCRVFITANCWMFALMVTAISGVWYYGLPLILVGALVAPERCD